MHKSLVSIIRAESCTYPAASTLFRPHTAYPEYPFNEVAAGRNDVYAAVRDALRYLELDVENYGTKEWNPLGKIILPGNFVLIKPNLVSDVNGSSNGGTDCLFTHPSVVAAVVDYVVIALKGTGSIVVGDAPVQECNFERLISKSGYDKLILYYQNKGIDIKLLDFRQLKAKVKNGVHYNQIDDTVTGKIVDLRGYSEFSADSVERIEKMRITNYDPRILAQHHNAKTHEYYVSDYMLKADVIINIPKPKTHRKAGFTASLKNMVGITTRKECLPHHTKGGQTKGGDEYLQESAFYTIRGKLEDKKNIFIAENAYFRAKILRLGEKACSSMLWLERKNVKEGSWYGNHTISRTVADLNKIVYYADKNGLMQNYPARRMIIIADMIISGENEGPLKPTPKAVGIIAAGTNPVCFDETICTLMGFDVKKVPTLACIRSINTKYKIAENDDIPFVVSNLKVYNGKTIEELLSENLFHFIPAAGWQGHIEIQ